MRGAPQRGFACAIVRITVRMSADTVDRSRRCRLFQAHHSRKPRRCQAMTVSGLTITSAVRHPVQMHERRAQSHWSSVFASPSRGGRDRWRTCSRSRNASTSSCRAARDRAHVRSVRRRVSSTDIIDQKRIHRRPQHQLPQQERTFQYAHAPTICAIWVCAG
jgi:hypothetical protein